MDGYAIRHEATQAATKTSPISLNVTSKVFAGDISSTTLLPGEAIKIMTGGMIPLGATAVIPQELVEIHPGSITIMHAVHEGENIRWSGEEVHAGDLVAKPHLVITPAVIGHLAALGIYKVPIFSPPQLAVIPTGSELIRDPQQLSAGKVFESNSFALGAALKQMGLTATISSLGEEKPPFCLRTSRQSCGQFGMLL